MVYFSTGNLNQRTLNMIQRFWRGFIAARYSDVNDECKYKFDSLFSSGCLFPFEGFRDKLQGMGSLKDCPGKVEGRWQRMYRD